MFTDFKTVTLALMDWKVLIPFRPAKRVEEGGRMPTNTKGAGDSAESLNISRGDAVHPETAAAALALGQMVLTLAIAGSLKRRQKRKLVAKLDNIVTDWSRANRSAAIQEASIRVLQPAAKMLLKDLQDT
ncbi:MAG: hypothetical protein ACYDD1_17455 [Caulobacteraceae bacterium]